nr:MAG TPA: hypothetical protein [Caudoviricetes sp.]
MRFSFLQFFSCSSSSFNFISLNCLKHNILTSVCQGKMQTFLILL